MERDERVFLLGEDIGVYGGAFKVTEGFIERFGPQRVMDTPIVEETIVGAALGAAMEGLRPVAEFQYADFMSSGYDEITTALARYHYRSGVPVPVVLRGPSGGGRSRLELPLARTPSRGSRRRPVSRSSAPRSLRTPRGC